MFGFVALPACSDDADPDPMADATLLAEGLEERSLGDVGFVEGDTDATAELAAVVAGMATTPVDVALVSVIPDPDDSARAAVTLHWSWTVAQDAVWEYDSTATMSLIEGEWNVHWDPAMVEPSLVAGERLALTPFTDGMQRGEILGAAGVQIMGPKPVYRVGIDKAHVDPSQLESSIGYLADHLGLEDPAAYRNRVLSAGPSAFVEALVVRADGSYPLDMSTIAAIPGARAIDDVMDLAPTRDFARPIVGTVGPATAERIEQSGGALREGDITGLSGLQLRYEERLRGTPGLAVEAVGGSGRRELFRVRPEPGTSLTTTLDVGLQLIAEDILSGVEPASALVAIRPSDGHVLVAASGPGSAGLSTATTGRYPPGSTFKVVSSLAFLRAGLDPSSPVECPETVVVNGRQFSNHSGYPPAKTGTISLLDAIANSCNTALINQHGLVTQQDVADAAASLGIGQATDLGIPAFTGSIPADGGVVDHAAAMIGQARVQTSPLNMATVAASVVAGHTVTPVFVLDDDRVDGEAPPEVTEPLTEAEAVHLRALMRAVVVDGTASFLADIPGPDIGAKTGTAEYGLPDDEGELATHAWMIAFRGDLAVAVFVEDGEGGSATAGPLLEAFLRALPQV